MPSPNCFAFCPMPVLTFILIWPISFRLPRIFPDSRKLQMILKPEMRVKQEDHDAALPDPISVAFVFVKAACLSLSDQRCFCFNSKTTQVSSEHYG
jgi:hypothetical protein